MTVQSINQGINQSIEMNETGCDIVRTDQYYVNFLSDFIRSFIETRRYIPVGKRHHEQEIEDRNSVSPLHLSRAQFVVGCWRGAGIRL